jgi:transposase
MPVFDIGARGAFDENGVSYPWIVDSGGALLMYYVGWMPTVLTPFQNHLGLAIRSPGTPWRRYSRAPILERTDEEFLSIGSAAVVREGTAWRMWYTCFREWGVTADAPKHIYTIKYAESSDGLVWNRRNHVCIEPVTPHEYAIGRPSVLVDGGLYHMWYSYRGPEYRIGYAWSADGVRWTRRDDLAGIDVSPAGWDSAAICYSHVFKWHSDLYMIYCGNHYGRDGLGMARWVDK